VPIAGPPLVSIHLRLVPTNDLIFDALGDATRRTILEELLQRPSAVGELAERLPVSRPAVSQHLKVLRDAGLVIDQRAGSRRIYQVDPAGIAELRSYLDRFWGLALRSFQSRVEQKEKGKS
jgi:DNA-binding transcriptional ArsR family regulator